MELTKAAGLWIGVLLELLLAFAGTGEALHHFDEPSYFSEGGHLLTRLSLVSKRNVTARKEAVESTSSLEKSIQQAEPTYIKESEHSTVRVVQTSHSEAAHQKYAESTVSTPKSNDTLLYNVSSTESPVNASAVAFNSTKTVTASDKSVVVKNSTGTPSPGKKTKPAITFDIEDLPRDENGNVIVSKESLVGAGPSFDFVVPIVIALLAVPFIAVLGAYAYKKSRDFWDRRHYRRMDFLIDGMYND